MAATGRPTEDEAGLLATPSDAKGVTPDLTQGATSEDAPGAREEGSHEAQGDVIQENAGTAETHATGGRGVTPANDGTDVATPATGDIDVRTTVIAAGAAPQHATDTTDAELKSPDAPKTRRSTRTSKRKT